MTGPLTITPIAVAIDVVICTFNRAASLDEVLFALSAQHPEGVSWSVLVVDNASTDRTPDVVEAHRARRLLPGLRRVVESEQGLTPARQCGVRETSAPWIAFVDDDNLLAPRWLGAIADAIRSHPEAGGIGGRVLLDWEQQPPGFFKGFGWCFAEQDPGPVAQELNSLVGAGMVVRRDVLVECSWLERPLLADRVGKSLVSGGDVEIAQRIRGAGYLLRFAPEAVLYHRIPKKRISRQYLFRVNYGLGGSAALVSALTWRGDWSSWRRDAQWRSIKGMVRPLRLCRGLTAGLAGLFFAIGYVRGVLACEARAPAQRRELLGAAVPKTRPLPSLPTRTASSSQ